MQIKNNRPVVAGGDYKEKMIEEEEQIMVRQNRTKEVQADQVEKLLANELNCISIEGREKLLEEIHGVKRTQDERISIEKENLLFEQLQAELDELERRAQTQTQTDPDTDKPRPGPSLQASYATTVTSQSSHSPYKNLEGSVSISVSTDSAWLGPSTSSTTTATATITNSPNISTYQKAKQLKSEWINDRQFRWAFLKRENFNPKSAALCFVRYFDLIYRAFDSNEELLMRPICFRDIDPVARKLLHDIGPLQILPRRDPSGRRIFVKLRDMNYDDRSEVQVAAFFAQCLSEDRSGAVCVTFLHNFAAPEEVSTKKLLNMKELTTTLPFKFDAFHMCFPNSALYFLFGSILTLYFGRENRIRRRVHIGSYEECRYSLKGFGIGVDLLPTNLDSWRCTHDSDMKDFRKWLKMRGFKDTSIMAAFKENSNSSVVFMEAVNRVRTEYIECPYHEDCLFGKGPSVMNHAGNVGMRGLVQKHYELWNFVSKRRKRKVAEDIVRTINDGGGRFLKEHSMDVSGLLKEVDSEVAIRKVMIGFFNLKKKRALQAKQSGIKEGPPLPAQLSTNETPGHLVGSSIGVSRSVRKRQIDKGKDANVNSVNGSVFDDLCSSKNRRLLHQSDGSNESEERHICTSDCFCNFKW